MINIQFLSLNIKKWFNLLILHIWFQLRLLPLLIPFQIFLNHFLIVINCILFSIFLFLSLRRFRFIFPLPKPYEILHIIRIIIHDIILLFILFLNLRTIIINLTDSAWELRVLFLLYVIWFLTCIRRFISNELWLFSFPFLIEINIYFYSFYLVLEFIDLELVVLNNLS